jgi:hypothetical protein
MVTSTDSIRGRHAKQRGTRSSIGSEPFILFAVVLGAWATFGAALLVAPESLPRLWNDFVTQPLFGQIAIAAVLLPWVVVLAIWQAGWPLAVRLIGMLATALVSIYMFYPREPKKMEDR